ncbi:MAG: hypothetical protein Q8K60_04440 [Parachlamydiaceae bacterium]|nr:hypothetical protein [Parachlamydiaceae bacterium]
MGDPIVPNIEPTGVHRYEGVSDADPIEATKVSRDSLGSVMRLEVRKLSVDNDSIKPEAPQISKPDQLTLSGPNRKEDSLELVLYPKIVPFLAILSFIMNELARSQGMAHYMESGVAMKQFENIQTSYKISSEITKSTAEKEAAMYLSQAISSIGQGLSSFGQIGLSAQNIAKTKGDTEVVDFDRQIAAKEAERDAPVVADQAVVRRPVEEIEKDIQGLKNQKSEIFNKKLQQFNYETQWAVEGVKNSIGAVSQLSQSSIASEKGQLEAERQVEEGYKQAFQSRYDTSVRSRDEAASNISRTLDSLKDMTKSYINATKIGQ